MDEGLMVDGLVRYTGRTYGAVGSAAGLYRAVVAANAAIDQLAHQMDYVVPDGAPVAVSIAASADLSWVVARATSEAVDLSMRPCRGRSMGRRRVAGIAAIPDVVFDGEHRLDVWQAAFAAPPNLA
jgi:hypothetical protein